MKKRSIIGIIITLVLGLVMFYIFLPPINIQSFEFWSFLFFLLIVYTLSSGVIKLDRRGKISLTDNFKIGGKLIFGFLALFALIMLTNLVCSPLFQSDEYANRIEINEDGDFVKDIAEVDLSKLPLIDKASSEKLGDRVMGQMPEMVSQYYVSDIYTQINYNDTIIRVTPLEYNGLFKFIKNHKTGVTGYITVDSVSGDANLVKVDKGMKYMPSAYLNKNLYRHLRFKYPTAIFGRENFEIDNEGNPYWVIPTIKYTAVGLRREVNGVIIMDPVTGKSKRYDVKDVPTWVDHVYDADLIIEEVDDWGQYKKGFLNSIFSQTNVVMTTEGYNYTVMNDDVYLYTGITSVSSDEANVGFILTNMRTKETNYYAVPGAEEYSAMASAEGQVQQMKYISTFPLLINLNNKPTYLMSLKDNAGLVKMYALVDVQNYQRVVVTDASLGIEAAVSNYLEGSSYESSEGDFNKEITISNINPVNIDGNTYYYFTDTDGYKYRASIKVDKSILPFMEKGDFIKVFYKKEKEVIEVVKVEK